MAPRRLAHAGLLTAATASLLAVLALRVYAAGWTVPIRTLWDDSTIRLAARTETRDASLPAAVARLALPNPPPLLEGRLNGYQRWLVLGLKLGRRVAPGQGERAFQAVNVLLFALQAATVLLFAWWAARDAAFAAGFAFLWVSSPVVFGMSRWILAENLVLAAGPLVSFLAAWLLGRDGDAGPRARSRGARLLGAGAVAYGIGLFSAAREYVAPSLLVVLGATALGLVLQRRRLEAAAFVSVIACFLAPLATPLAAAVRSTLAKGGQVEWFHPLGEWLPHVFVHTVGPALTLALAVLVGAVVVRPLAGDAPPPGGAAPGGRLRGELTGLRGLYWAHLFLLAADLAGIALVRNRVSRIALMPMLAALGLALVGTRVFPRVRQAVTTTRAKGALLVLVLASWGVLSYQLLVAFDGGNTYAHAAYRLEYYNHPLHLRPLGHPYDTHVCFDPCPYDEAGGP